MSLAYIRHAYGVPAKRYGRVRFIDSGSSREGTIVKALGHYLRVLFDGERIPRTMHPTWRIEYLGERSGSEKRSVK